MDSSQTITTMPNGYTVNAFVSSKELHFRLDLFINMCVIEWQVMKMRKCQCTFQLWHGQKSNWSEWQRFRALWPRTVKLSVALVSPKWDRHLGTDLNNLFPQWNDWWAGIRWYWCGVEWSRVKSSGGSPIFGSAPVVPWFISTAPQRPQGGDLSVSRHCVLEDELGLQIHTPPQLCCSL